MRVCAYIYGLYAYICIHIHELFADATVDAAPPPYFHNHTEKRHIYTKKTDKSRLCGSICIGIYKYVCMYI